MAAEKNSPRITDAVLLAAGYGERLRPITLDVPKPALHFLNRPLICRLLDSLADYGVKRVFINTHHLPEQIVEAASSFRGKMELAFSHEPEILGTAGLFFDLKERLHGPFFVLNGDMFLEPQLGMLEERLLRGSEEAVLLLKKRRPGDSYTPVSLDPEGMVSSIGEGEHFFCGVYAARRLFIDRVTERKKEDLVPLILKPSIMAGKVGGTVLEGAWHDLGSAKSFLEATRDCLDKMRNGIMRPPPGSRFEASLSCSSLIEDSAVLGEAVKLKGFAAIGQGCIIGKGAFIENSVILPGTAVAEGTKVTGSIVLGGRTAKG
ncbi:MAG TPA: NDP-sugar synthase [Acidobacteriota bacterium]|nr:NDP-sugar synthase [Acidobacteriota bacterium]HNT17444.1 NDP-sugar synthase [Acidobacteriota bacterium]HPA26200.1 NDP-sugar synthase [Acidobacteriota bacterium]HQO18758.1 NDP-sugar synthase [Acidobacteriota bacterium]HQQ46883.1 NDP-sugar synthase [Acidobacteriota bacterium]